MEKNRPTGLIKQVILALIALFVMTSIIRGVGLTKELEVSANLIALGVALIYLGIWLIEDNLRWKRGRPYTVTTLIAGVWMASAVTLLIHDQAPTWVLLGIFLLTAYYVWVEIRCQQRRFQARPFRPDTRIE